MPWLASVSARVNVPGMNARPSVSSACGLKLECEGAIGAGVATAGVGARGAGAILLFIAVAPRRLFASVGQFAFFESSPLKGGAVLARDAYILPQCRT